MTHPLPAQYMYSTCVLHEGSQLLATYPIQCTFHYAVSLCSIHSPSLPHCKVQCLGSKYCTCRVHVTHVTLLLLTGTCTV